MLLSSKLNNYVLYIHKYIYIILLIVTNFFLGYTVKLKSGSSSCSNQSSNSKLPAHRITNSRASLKQIYFVALQYQRIACVPCTHATVFKVISLQRVKWL